MLQKDIQAFTPSLLQTIIKAILPIDYIKALAVGEELGDIFAFGNWNEFFFPVARLLLYPTIYDSSTETVTIPPILANALLNQEDVMEQLVFVKWE